MGYILDLMPVHHRAVTNKCTHWKTRDNVESPIDLTLHVSGLWESSGVFRTISHLTDKERNFQASSDPYKMLPFKPKYPNLVWFVFSLFFFCCSLFEFTTKICEDPILPSHICRVRETSGQMDSQMEKWSADEKVQSLADHPFVHKHIQTWAYPCTHTHSQTHKH